MDRSDTAGHANSEIPAFLSGITRSSWAFGKEMKMPEIGSLFCVPLPDGTFSIAQVIGREPDVLNSVTCLFTRLRVESFPKMLDSGISLDDMISAQFVTPDLLKKGRWKSFQKTDVYSPDRVYPYIETKKNGWIGAKVIGSRIIEEFLAAFHGLAFWDDWSSPMYLDGLLLPNVSRPTGIKLKTEQSHPANPRNAGG